MAEYAKLTPPPDGDVNHSNGFIAALIVVTSIAVLFAWMRMYVRLFIMRNTWWDDWTMFAASV